MIRRIHQRRVHLITAGMLGAIQRAVGLGGQTQAVIMQPEGNHTCTKRTEQIGRLRRIMDFRETMADFLQHLMRALDIRVRNDDGKFIAPVT